MALSILLHPPTALWRREALAASRGTFWVRMDGASSLRIYSHEEVARGRRQRRVGCNHRCLDRRGSRCTTVPLEDDDLEHSIRRTDFRHEFVRAHRGQE